MSPIDTEGVRMISRNSVTDVIRFGYWRLAAERRIIRFVFGLAMLCTVMLCALSIGGAPPSFYISIPLVTSMFLGEYLLRCRRIAQDHVTWTVFHEFVVLAYPKRTECLAWKSMGAIVETPHGLLLFERVMSNPRNVESSLVHWLPVHTPEETRVARQISAVAKENGVYVYRL